MEIETIDTTTTQEGEEEIPFTGSPIMAMASMDGIAIIIAMEIANL